MRTQEQIAQIKSRVISPYAKEDFISASDVDHLVSLFYAQQTETNKVHKNTGPITLDLKIFLDDPVVSSILDKLTLEIGQYEITAAFFFTATYPHIIHNDDTFELPDGVYRGITIPLKLEGGTELPKLCFFDQFYFHGPAKFFNGSKEIPTYYNKQVYNYADVDGIVNTEFKDPDNLFTHLNPQWLKGLSLHSSLDWKPTSALIFDSVRLHCASDFRKLNIQSKLGISIFTKVL